MKFGEAADRCITDQYLLCSLRGARKTAGLCNGQCLLRPSRGVLETGDLERQLVDVLLINVCSVLSEMQEKLLVYVMVSVYSDLPEVSLKLCLYSGLSHEWQVTH